MIACRRSSPPGRRHAGLSEFGEHGGRPIEIRTVVERQREPQANVTTAAYEQPAMAHHGRTSACPPPRSGASRGTCQTYTFGLPIPNSTRISNDRYSRLRVGPDDLIRPWGSGRLPSLWRRLDRGDSPTSDAMPRKHAPAALWSDDYPDQVCVVVAGCGAAALVCKALDFTQASSDAADAGLASGRAGPLPVAEACFGRWRDCLSPRSG